MANATPFFLAGAVRRRWRKALQIKDLLRPKAITETELGAVSPAFAETHCQEPWNRPAGLLPANQALEDVAKDVLEPVLVQGV